MSEIKKIVPFIPLRGQVFFPDTVVGFDIGRDKTLKAVELAMNDDRCIVAAAQRDTSVNDPHQEDCYEVGVLLRIKQVVKRSDEYVRVLASVGKRVRILTMLNDERTFYCTYEEMYDEYAGESDEEFIALMRVLEDTYFKYVELSGSGETAARALLEDVNDPAQMANMIAGEMDVDYEIKQGILELDRVTERVEALLERLNYENEILRLTRRINGRVMQNMNKGQKDYYLREQLKVIREELGEGNDAEDEIREWTKQLDELKLPEKTDAKVRKEIDKFSKMNMMSPDASVSRTYIETILSLPWRKASKTNINLKRAEKILNEDHYGLEKVKERILEYLAVMHLTREIKGPIICLVG